MRKGGVLVALGADRTRERHAALDHELLGQRPSTRVGGQHAGGCYQPPSRAHPRTIRAVTDDLVHSRPRRLGAPLRVHEERAAAPPRPRRRGRRARLRPRARRGRGGVGQRRAAARLRLRVAPDARQAPAGRRADPARAGLSRNGSSAPSCARGPPATWSARRDLEHVLFACDESAGFVHACGLVRPDGLATLEPPSVKKKLKQKSFAAGVNRDDVRRGRRGARRRPRRRTSSA